MEYCTLFVKCPNGDWNVLAALNDGDGLIKDFDAAVLSVVTMLSELTGETIMIMDHQNAPDDVEL